MGGGRAALVLALEAQPLKESGVSEDAALNRRLGDKMNELLADWEKIEDAVKSKS